MSIKKLTDATYLVDIRPQGCDGKRIRRKFNTKGEAQIFERYIIARYQDKAWLDKSADRRKLTELLSLWWVYHGKHHVRGEIDRSRLHSIVNHLSEMGVTRADQLTHKTIIDYRIRMLDLGLKPASVNRHQAILSGMFTKLISAGEYHNAHPFREVKKLREGTTEMAFLTTDEIKTLLQTLEGDNLKVAQLCLATGGRWGEVSNLKGEHIIKNVITFMKTKNGKRRSVPVSDELVRAIKTKASGRLFISNYNTVRMTLRKVKPDLPKGQAAHVLRHTFATHFMMNGGNIITLQRVLGHATIQQTMTYAHFAPGYLQDAITFNPLNSITV